MTVFNEQLPEWKNAGIRPVEGTIEQGWKVKDKPPAAWFNWAWHQTYMCLKEIRDYIDAERGSKNPISLETAIATGSTYVVTSKVQAATSYVDGMVLNIVANGSSLTNMSLDLDGLGAKPIFANNEKLQRMAMLNGRVYSLVYVQAKEAGTGGWVVMNLVNKLEFPPVYNADLNQVNYSFYCLTNVLTTNVPQSQVANDRFFVTSQINIDNGLIYQTAKSIITFEEYFRIINNVGVVQKDWALVTGAKRDNLVRNTNLYSDGMGSGMVITFNANPPYNVSVSSGFLYVNNIGLIEKREAQANVAMPETTNGTYNVYVDRAGQCHIVKAGITPPSYCVFSIGTITLTNSVMSGPTRSITKVGIVDAGLSDMPANTIKGRRTTAGTPENLTPDQAKEILSISDVPHLGTTTNVDNAYSIVSTINVQNGKKFSVKFNVAATGLATLNVSSDGTNVPLIKPGGGNFLPKEGIYSFIRDGLNFQLLGEGGEYGTAQIQHVLAPYTIGTDDGLKTGTIPSKSAASFNPSQSPQVISAGQYLSGDQTIQPVSFDASKVLEDTTIAGKTGTMVNRGSGSANITTKAQQVNLSSGYYSGGTIQIDPTEQAKIIPENIMSGVTILGQTGNLTPALVATGSFPAGAASTNIDIILPFAPKVFMMETTNSSGNRYGLYTLGVASGVYIYDSGNYTSTDPKVNSLNGTTINVTWSNTYPMIWKAWGN